MIETLLEVISTADEIIEQCYENCKADREQLLTEMSTELRQIEKQIANHLNSKNIES